MYRACGAAAKAGTGGYLTKEIFVGRRDRTGRVVPLRRKDKVKPRWNAETRRKEKRRGAVNRRKERKVWCGVVWCGDVWWCYRGDARGEMKLCRPYIAVFMPSMSMPLSRSGFDGGEPSMGFVSR